MKVMNELFCALCMLVAIVFLYKKADNATVADVFIATAISIISLVLIAEIIVLTQ